jgi:hypothetical protein
LENSLGLPLLGHGLMLQRSMDRILRSLSAIASQFGALQHF